MALFPSDLISRFLEPLRTLRNLTRTLSGNRLIYCGRARLDGFPDHFDEIRPYISPPRGRFAVQIRYQRICR